VPVPLAEEATLAAVERHACRTPWIRAGTGGSKRGRGGCMRRRLRRRPGPELRLLPALLRAAGLENFYMDLVADTEFAEALMDATWKFAWPWRSGPPRGGDSVDIVVVTSDDLG